MKEKEKRAYAEAKARLPSWDCLFEGVPLSLGVRPEHTNIDTVTMRGNEDWPIRSKFLERYKTVKLYIEEEHIPERLPPKQFIAFLEAAGLDDGLSDLMRKAVANAPTFAFKSSDSIPSEDASKKSDPRVSDLQRQLTLCQKIIYAFALKHGYDPGRERNEATERMRSMLKSNGVEVSAGALRKHIKAGHEEL